MKPLFFALAGILTIDSAHAQDARPSLEEMITQAWRTGMSEGHLTKQLRMSGDEAAVALTKVIAEKSVTDTEIDVALDFFSEAFSNTRAVSIIPDREPRAALLLLRYFDCVTQNAGLKAKIGNTRRTIMDAAATAAHNP